MKNLDKKAYDIICNWHKTIGFNPVYNGIDYSLIIRFYLWDKVGRALRLKNNIDFGEIEFYKMEYRSFPQYFTPLIPNGNFKKWFFSNKKLIFIPFQSTHTNELIRKLKTINKVKPISKTSNGILSKRNIIGSINYNTDEIWSKALCKNLILALQSNGIELIVEDKWLLENQIIGTVSVTNLAIAELKSNKPHALYVHSDNHPPYINYVLAAQKLAIPTFTSQHGLDCEHYFLDDCFADYVGIWSKARMEKYQMNSSIQPKSYKVTGNFFLERITKKNLTSSKKRQILFITRPHKPIKCYSPSRNFKEGVEILDVILKYLKQNQDVFLKVKPHPMDSVSLYEDSIVSNGLSARAGISNGTLDELIQQSTIIVTEDSTGGVEAMRFGKPLIHANLSNVTPVLPFVENRAALPGFSRDELLRSIDHAFKLKEDEKGELFEHQKLLANKLMPVGRVDTLVDFIITNI
ncbi:hypothetical protein [Tamlana crocina]|uniref:UDP-N-acetylglucosamine 2-epimerase domain-containing protein n=1 Tax=Tamlana crocina TaxID=393006 RepID=A0ABX1D9I1_9FLAO|nr:hypothetical protein [Tamlana crocina]NJX15030.1 hypothetical protein [Tamlana crocina]